MNRASPPISVSAMGSIDMILVYTLCDLLWSTGAYRASWLMEE